LINDYDDRVLVSSPKRVKGKLYNILSQFENETMKISKNEGTRTIVRISFRIV
jgi:hypothetical protein